VPVNPDDPRWTVMVFMGADTVDGEAPLLDAAWADISEMRRSMEKAKKVPDHEAPVSIFVQLHTPNFVHCEHIGHPPETRDVDPVGVTNGRALTEFIDESIAKAGHSPRDHSMLVLWGHAYQFAIARAKIGARQDALDFAELADVLRTRQDEHKESQQDLYGQGQLPKVDIVGFDACDIATIEMAVQLYEFADYLLASQIEIPLPGWPYDRILDRLINPKGRRMGPAEFGTYVVRRFCEKYHAEDRKVSLTLLDLKRAREIYGYTEVLALALAVAIAQNPDEQRLVRELFLRSRTDEHKAFVDVADLCLSLLRYSSDQFVRDAAELLGDLLISPPPGDLGPEQSAVGARRPFIVEHGRNSARTARLHGVSLYAPSLAPTGQWEEASYWYRKFVFARETQWNDLVHALALGT
jgi:hypothetical protein